MNPRAYRFATEANIAWLRENGYRYLAVTGHRTSLISPAKAFMRAGEAVPG